MRLTPLALRKGSRRKKKRTKRKGFSWFHMLEDADDVFMMVNVQMYLTITFDIMQIQFNTLCCKQILTYVKVD